MEIECIRGVNIDGVVRHLLKLGLIKPAGRKDVIGKPFLYVTTRKFLEYFGLNSLNNLPKLEEFSGFDNLAKDVGGIDTSETEHIVTQRGGTK